MRRVTEPLTRLFLWLTEEERDGKGNAASDKRAGWATLWVGLAVSGFLFWKNQSPMPFEEYYVLNIALLLSAPFLTILMFLRRDARDFGFTTGNLRGGVRFALVSWAVFLPILLVFAPQDSYQRYYLGVLLGNSRAVTGLWPTPTGYAGGILNWDRLLFHETVLCFYMIAWEWFFRGFLLFGLKKAFPTWFAVLVQAALFMLLHWNKPWAEIASSFAGGILLGMVALRCRSFLPCFLLHFMVSSSFDLSVLYFHFRGTGLK